MAPTRCEREHEVRDAWVLMADVFLFLVHGHPAGMDGTGGRCGLA